MVVEEVMRYVLVDPLALTVSRVGVMLLTTPDRPLV
jgi:hypothetical protein